MEQFFQQTKVVLALAIVFVCLFGNALPFGSEVFHEFQAALLSSQWKLLLCLAIWCYFFIFLTFNSSDLLLISLLLIAVIAYFNDHEAPLWMSDAIILLAGVTLGKGMRFALMEDGKNNPEIGNWKPEIVNVLVGLVVLLAFSSWWHLRMASSYHGPRWMGFWDNPNDYGMLMGAGVVLAIGLVAATRNDDGRWKMEDREIAGRQKAEGQKLKAEPAFTLFWRGKSGKQKLLIGFLLVAAFMMAVGLVMSYSRGAWVGTAIGLLYLTKHTKAESGKRKAKTIWYLLPVVLLVAAVILVSWKTPDTSPWYLKRLDLNRGSVQHRVAAWKTSIEMMRDHPFGVGWNKTVGTYAKNYSPPEGGVAAITTNDYLMLGTQLGIPALLCFIAYVALCLRSPKSKVQSLKSEPASADGQDWRRLFSAVFFLRKSAASAEENMSRADARPTTLDVGHWTLDARLRIACRSAAIAMLVACWFDGGLFKLATAAVFWILLELGAERRFKPRMDTGMNTDFGLQKDAKNTNRLNPQMAQIPQIGKQKSASFCEIRGLTARLLRFFAAIKSAIGNRKCIRASAATK